MKISLTVMLLLQCLLNEASANLDGQTNERVPLLNEDGSTTGTTITCTPYSVEDERSGVEFVKYVLDDEEEANSTVVWNSQSNIILFEECASYAAEQNVGMFYFDGQTCETSDTVYERKEKTCDSTAAKMVYLQKGFQPVSTNCVEDGNNHNDGDEWDLNGNLPCGVTGKKTCVNGVIIPERKYENIYENSQRYTQHVEGVDYFPITNACFIKPETNEEASTFGQDFVCEATGAFSCSPIGTAYNSTTLTVEIKAFLGSPVANSMETSYLTVASFQNFDGEFFLGNDDRFPFDFPASNDPLENCIVFNVDDPYRASASNCQEEKTYDICCMLRG